MKLLKKINNNYAIALDSKGEEIIVSGRGIGFNKMPCEIKDLSIIDRTYYDIDICYYDILSSIPESVMKVSSIIIKIIENNINTELNSNFIFSLADHISFCITRYKKRIRVNMPLAYDLLQQYPIETEIGFKALDLIQKECGIRLRDSEAYGIAMSIINAENNVVNNVYVYDEEEIINNITEIVEEQLNIEIDRKGFNYTRYATHIHYLIQRIQNKNQITTMNNDVYQSVKSNCSAAYECAIRISEYIGRKMKCKLCNEEKLYIILHVDRLASREDCNQ